MAVLQGVSGDVVEAGNRSYNSAAPLHTIGKPIQYSTLGHYRQSVRFTMATTQGANSRLWEVRNSHASNLLVPTRMEVSVMPAGTVTTAYRLEIDLFKLTSFSAVDTTNTVTPGTASNKRSTMTTTPTCAVFRHVTVAGNASGMTGGTLTKDATAAGIAQCWVATAAATTLPFRKEMLDDVNGTHPWVLVQNEGLLLENIVEGSGTANVVDVAVDFSWAEVTAF
jgi:hypothetical protein